MELVSARRIQYTVIIVDHFRLHLPLSRLDSATMRCATEIDGRSFLPRGCQALQLLFRGKRVGACPRRRTCHDR